MNLYFIYDVLSNSIVRVLSFVNDDVCLRFLSQALKVPNSPFALNFDDTILVCYGKVDEKDLSLLIDDSSFNCKGIDFKGRLIAEYSELNKGGKNEKSK